MESLTQIIRFFQDGGLFMYPIVLVLALGIAIAIERFIYLNRAGATNHKLWQRVQPLIVAGQYHEAAAAVAKSKAPLTTVVGQGLQRAKQGRAVDELEAVIEEGLMEVLPRLEKRTHYLATFANIATLLGLLGTVIGLMEAFTAISHADPAQKAELLSSSISVAMNTTAFGLMVAIPLLLVHTFLHQRTNEIIEGLEMMSVKFINVVINRGT